MKRSILLVLSALLVAGCAAPKVIQLTPDTYLISRASAAGMFVNMPALKAEVIQQAQAFAASKGQRAEPVNMNETFPAHGFPSFDYQFRLVAISNTPAMPKESN